MSNSGWTTPADVRTAIRKKWDSGALAIRYLSGADWEPASAVVRGPVVKDIGENLAEVQRWSAQWAEAAARGPLRVEYKQVGGRYFGANSLPARAWLDSYDSAWSLLGVRGEVRRLEEMAGTPGGDWVRSHPMRALRLAGEWEKLLAVVDWIAERQRPGMYLRQVDVPGVDTKFIERHRGVLAELLDRRLGLGRVDESAADFATRYGFARKPDYVRFRCGFLGFRGLSEASVRVSELSVAPPGVSRVFVVENEITYLAFPLPEKAMVIWGRGYAVDALAPLRWLAELDVVYWGDIDTHGFAILSRLRGMFPCVRSMLMDRETLLAHRDQWVREPSPSAGSLAGLTPEESALYADLAGGVFGDQVRLEQERVRFGAVERAIRVGTNESQRPGA
ncbi:MAG: Wadjet anti-phage system protein JetD domain-containing protein [Trebonia sp.]